MRQTCLSLVANKKADDFANKCLIMRLESDCPHVLSVLRVAGSWSSVWGLMISKNGTFCWTFQIFVNVIHESAHLLQDVVCATS